MDLDLLQEISADRSPLGASSQRVAHDLALGRPHQSRGGGHHAGLPALASKTNVHNEPHRFLSARSLKRSLRTRRQYKDI